MRTLSELAILVLRSQALLRRVVLALALGLATEVVNADVTFGTPTNPGSTVNSSSGEGVLRISADGLSLYFASTRPGGYGGLDIWVTTRATKADPWGTPMNLGPPVNSSAEEYAPSISADGLLLFFASNRSGGYGGDDIWMTTRETTADHWGAPMNLGALVNSGANDRGPSISADALGLFFHSSRSGGSGGRDIWVTTRTTTGDPWGEPVNLGPIVNSSSEEVGPSISADGLLLFFASNRPGGYGSADVWVTTRDTIDDEWGTPMNLGPPVNSSAEEFAPSISPDGRPLYFTSDRPGGLGQRDVWRAAILPIVDFNGDGEVDSFEVCTMADRWGTDDSLCDIGPMSWGDGIVDVQDLKVLAEYIGKDVDDPTLITHWALDEAEGDVAYDSSHEKDGLVVGGVTWHPEDGAVGGALGLDGVDAYVETPGVLNPADGPFSVLAWIRGGALGQTIVSQADGVNWLMIDALTGTFATELAPPARRNPVPPLVSDAVISDDIWHRVAFVWDGASRNLYVDGVLVATDEQDKLEGSFRELYIGCGADEEPGTFFSGLVDDVRIYDRAVRP